MKIIYEDPSKLVIRDGSSILEILGVLPPIVVGIIGLMYPQLLDLTSLSLPISKSTLSYILLGVGLLLILRLNILTITFDKTVNRAIGSERSLLRSKKYEYPFDQIRKIQLRLVKGRKRSSSWEFGMTIKGIGNVSLVNQSKFRLSWSGHAYRILGGKIAQFLNISFEETT